MLPHANEVENGNDVPAKRKRAKGPKRTFMGAPMSIESRTGKHTVITVDYGKKPSKLTEAEKQNLIKMDGIVNIPDGFGWTDLPFIQKDLTCATSRLQDKSSKHKMQKLFTKL